MIQTHPSGFALVLECFFSVLRGRLYVVDRVLHVILYAIYHLALVTTAAQRFVRVRQGGTKVTEDKRTKNHTSQLVCFVTGKSNISLYFILDPFSLLVRE